MHTRRLVVIVAALCALFVSIWMLPEAAASEGAREPEKPLAEMTLSASRIDWLSADASDHLVLTVAGPAGIWVRKEFAAGQPASLNLSDPEWEHLPDGTYTWELRVGSLPGTPERSLVESGHFFVKDGSFVPARKKASATPQRKPRLITAESHINDHLSVTGNVCIGTSCTSADPDPNLPSLILKGPQPHIRFDDQFVEGGSSPHDWALFINPSSAAELSIADVENSLIPFTIAGGAPNSSVYITSNGRVGLGTATPGAPLHLYGSATSDVWVAMGPDPSFTGTSFNVAYAGATFGRGVGLLNVRPDASATAPNPSLRFLTANVERMIVTNTGNVGIGTSLPATKLHVSGSNGSTQAVIEETNGTTATRTLLELKNNGASRINFVDSAAGSTWAINNTSGNLNMLRSGAGVTAASLTGSGTLTVTQVVETSDRDMKTDIVAVQPEDILTKVSRLPLAMWRFKNDEAKATHLGPMAQDFSAIFGLGHDDKHIKALDVAGVSLASIQALSRKVSEKEAEITELRQRLAALEELVAKLTTP